MKKNKYLLLVFTLFILFSNTVNASCTEEEVNPIYQPRCKNNKTNDTCPTSSYKWNKQALIYLKKTKKVFFFVNNYAILLIVGE